ncbi:histidine triad nucleotide-binding protein [Fangia hongkongensis]|uniref:histidine triad nucleotide-binding protein n=1 Tax=Fangia hongkongensis TaxID=270495 RepID=UPI000369F8CA|nr:histidine triad nucleotide-binding protein [Fangia hongkongensis]MBK2126034.1 histidine triad nucleotide-binding protein [Fangia hongkongensis]
MSNCIFCSIIKGDIPSNKVYEDDDILAFHDIQPAADVHVLVIPKKHIASLNELDSSDEKLIAKLTLHIPKIAKTLGLDAGYKTLINTGKGGGQQVFHLHYHIIGGKIHALESLKHIG